MAGDVVDELGLADPDRVLPRPAPTPAYYAQRSDAKPFGAYGPQIEPAPTPRVFTLLTSSEVVLRPRLQSLIKGVAPRYGLMAIYGPWGSGKSFVTLSMIAAIGEGAQWFGHATKPGRVVYVALEGAEGVRQRIEAWERHHVRAFPEAVRFILDKFRLCDLVDAAALADAIEAAGGADMVVIDTLNRAAPQLDENNSKDMGQAIEGAQRLQDFIGGCVCLVAHSGKDASKGLRGHSSLPAALDAAIEVRNGANGREWAVAKLKDGAGDESHRFRLEVVEVGLDEDDDPITSCVVVPDLADAPLKRVAMPGGGNQRIVYDALGPVLRELGQYGKAGAPPSRPCIEIETAITKVRDRLPSEPARRNERAREAIKGLVARKVLCCNEGWIWLA